MRANESKKEKNKENIPNLFEYKYHRMFDYDGRIKLVELGHYESEQFTIELLYNKLNTLCKGLKLVKTNVKTNPVNYCI